MSRPWQSCPPPTPTRRSQEFEGRRIEPCGGGWVILNGEKYRNKMSLDERREYKRIKQRGYRERERVESCGQSGPQLTHTETDTDTDTKKTPSSSKLDSPHDLVKTVFNDWKKTLNHPKAVMDSKRTTKIKQALETYSQDDLKKAFRGCSLSPFHMGDNDRKQKYDDITLILRDAEHIERFMNYADHPPAERSQPYRSENETRPRKRLS